jgi:anthranilate synthase component 1
VREVQRDIAAGELYQLVLSVRFTVEGMPDPFAVYRALRRANPSPYLFFLDFGDLALAGSSPKRWYAFRDAGPRCVPSPAPAGVAVRGGGPPPGGELLADPKEAAEHVMLVDLAATTWGGAPFRARWRCGPTGPWSATATSCTW